MTDKELMQQALDAFNKMIGRKPEFVEQVISALQNRLAQPEQKPLSDAEADELVGRFARYELIRATEAKHGIVA